MSFILSAPAKINLSLRILGRRDDGFHEIDTLIVKLPGLADSLEFREAASFVFHCNIPDLPTDDSNLVVQAVRRFEASTGTRCRHEIRLTKHIPHGAGLGGGSSDAATTLMGLNTLCDQPLSTDELLRIAAAIGSDVPCFLQAGASRCTGRGEVVKSVPSPPPLAVLLLKPNFPVATPEAYRRWSTSREISGIPYQSQSLGELELVNDLERPVFDKHRFLAEVKVWLLGRPGVDAALLSGSGSTVFAVLKAGADGEAIASAARTELDPHLWHWLGTTAG